MSRILVTGGAGLIGHRVVKIFEDAGHDVRIIDNMTDYGLIPRDELDYLLHERLREIKHECIIHPVCISSNHAVNVFDTFRPDTLVHMASFPRQKVVNANPQAGAKVMCEGLLNLLEACVKYRVHRFIYISSSMVYGDFKDDVREDYDCKPQGQYGIMKYMGEKLVQDYSRKTGLIHTIIRPSAVYGPLDVEDRVVSKFMLTAMRGGTLKVNGANETLDFTFADDAATGIASATLSQNTHNKTYNITKSHSYSLLDAANLAIKIAGNGSIEVRDKDVDFPSRGALNIDAAKRDFGFTPLVDVEEGFQRYHDWFKYSEYWGKKLNK